MAWLHGSLRRDSQDVGQGYCHLRLDWSWRIRFQGGSLTWPEVDVKLLACGLSSSQETFAVFLECSPNMAEGFPRSE